MALYIQIVDDFGNPDAVSNLADAVIEKLIPMKVGFFRSESDVKDKLRTVINDLIRDGRVSVQNPVLKVCPHCNRAVSIWHTYPDGSVFCTDCKPKVE